MTPKQRIEDIKYLSKTLDVTPNYGLESVRFLLTLLDEAVEIIKKVDKIGLYTDSYGNTEIELEDGMKSFLKRLEGE